MKAKTKYSKRLLIILSVLSFAFISVFGLSLITGDQQQSNIGTSLASVQEPADINSDAVVDIVDLSILLSDWNSSGNLSDVNDDNIVDIVDLSILLSKWGQVTATPNNTPYADAGVNQSVQIGLDVTLIGAGSRDEDGDTMAYLWQQTSGPSANLSSYTVANPRFTPTITGIYEFMLTVNDGQVSSSDRTTVTMTEGTSQVKNDSKIIYLHHSTGGVIWGGGVPESLASSNSSNNTNYQIVERAFPGNGYPWANYPYDYWNIWVNHAGNQSYSGQDTLEILTQEYDVVMFKHCFPVSNIGPDTGNPDITSSTKSIENYKLQYNALKAKMHDFPNNKFIVWTGAVNTDANLSQAEGQRTREFFNWVKSTWDEPSDNIYLWDFYELETEGGLYLLDEYAASGGSDSHPNNSFGARVAPYFVDRLIDVIEGRGDITNLTGE